ncbi:pilus assembly protein TadG-related protein [Aquibium sp. LZ166]|uniref:Pilus assembly protein TadG-related protein n=1 Tax=Aquibium pacificus TaxID=3153579 RepID=A0ABV3SLL2_9HYPH
MIGLARHFWTETAGNFAIVGVVAAVPIVGAAGLALTYGGAVLQKGELQNTLDSAVLAATSLGYSATDKDRLALAYAHAGVFQPKFGSDGKTFLSVNSDAPSFVTQGTIVAGTAELKMPNLFAGIIGADYISIVAHARAEKRESEPICLLALDATSAGSLSVYGNASVNAPNCTAMANSKNRQAVKQVGNKAELRALRIGITGSSSGKNIYPTPIGDVHPVEDPYVNLPDPKLESCASLPGKLSKGEFELKPGTYCGGLSISPGAAVRLLPGTYVMLDGPLTIGANSVLTGDEVTLAFFGPGSTLNSNSGSQITLSSPKSGTYKNIQFMSDGVKLPGKIGEEVFTLSSTTLTYDGAMYLPEQRVWVKGKSHVNVRTSEVAMVADRFRFQDASEVSILQEDEVATPSRFRYAARLTQ